jgi:hypothetical protein
MSLSDALSFIHRVRGNAELSEEVRSLGISPQLDEVAAIGARHGLAFSGEELRAAHRHDAAMRVVRYMNPGSAP